jgi:hypothetical protein
LALKSLVERLDNIDVLIQSLVGVIKTDQCASIVLIHSITVLLLISHLHVAPSHFFFSLDFFYNIVTVKATEKGDFGIYVHNIVPDSVAAQNGLLRHHDQLIEINGGWL